MKKCAILIFSALLMFSTTISAKEKNAKGPSIEARIDSMSTKLSLSDAEKANVKTLLEKQVAEKKEAAKDGDKESAEFKAKMKALNKKQNDELKAFLGNERFAKLGLTMKKKEKPTETKAK